MNLSELQVRKDLQQATKGWGVSRNLIELLQKHGWKALGTGAEGAVAEHPEKSYVLKIFDSDSKYTWFVNFVQMHAHYTNLPRFSRYVKPIPGMKLSYVRMEKLSKVSDQELVDSYGNYLVTMMAVGQAHRVEALSYGLKTRIQDKIDRKRLGVPSLDKPLQLAQIYRMLGGPPPKTWVDLITELCEFSKQQGIKYWDTHSGNFMLRDQTLVLTDPFV